MSLSVAEVIGSVAPGADQDAMVEKLLAEVSALRVRNDTLAKAVLAKPKAASKPFTVKHSSFTDKKGQEWPTVRFEGNFRPFSIGPAKVHTILEHAEEIGKLVNGS